MTRGLETLWFMRHLMNPLAFGRFALMLWSHKLLRWLVFLLVPVGLVGLILLAWTEPWARIVLAVTGVGILVGAAGYHRGETEPLPRAVAVLAFLVSGHVAGATAWYRAMRGELNPVWEPTRRG